MGTGGQRPLECSRSTSDCPDGEPAKGQKLLAPKALAAGPDGSVFLADYNLIRRILPDGTVDTLLKLK